MLTKYIFNWKIKGSRKLKKNCLNILTFIINIACRRFQTYERAPNESKQIPRINRKLHSSWFFKCLNDTKILIEMIQIKLFFIFPILFTGNCYDKRKFTYSPYTSTQKIKIIRLSTFKKLLLLFNLKLISSFIRLYGFS